MRTVHQLTCFGSRPGEGNAALVVLGDASSAAERQAFAREQNRSACVFVDAGNAAGADGQGDADAQYVLDYFYPHMRSPLCLHATLAAARVLLPAPDYPLWTAAVSLSGGTPVHYVCDEQQDWFPDIEDMRRKITSNTKAIVVINPNNPTGALYPNEILLQIIELARQHQLIIYADEIYDKVLYDEAQHTSIASLAEDVLMVTFNGLSKNYRACGYRAGWMVVSGEKRHAKDYIEGLNMLASMRLCANAPGQFAIQTALGGYQSIQDLVGPGGRLLKQRDLAYKLLTEIPGVTCVKPKAALYMFPRLDPKIYPIADDQQFAYDLLAETKVLIVQGTGFNWIAPDHFRVVFLPNTDDMTEAFGRIARFMEGYRKRHGSPI
eukprot:gene24291-30612_t